MNPKRAIEDRFPKLTGEGYSLTSSPTDAYNCVAWIARDVRRWWSPEDVDGYFWPWRNRDGTLSEYLRLFEHCGFAECVSGTLEDGYEKIAIFASSEEFDHVAFQREDGCWSSKLGELGDVMHKTLSSLGGAGCFEYADVAMFMRRVREPHPLAHTGLLLPGLG